MAVAPIGDETCGSRTKAAGVRACDAYLTVQRKAARLAEELEDTTAPHGVPVTELSDEDSMVVAIDSARSTLSNGHRK